MSLRTTSMSIHGWTDETRRRADETRTGADETQTRADVAQTGAEKLHPHASLSHSRTDETRRATGVGTWAR